MAGRNDANRAVEQFLRDQIDTVPHLEALLLLWNNRSELWSAASMAKRLFVAPEVAEGVLNDLVRREFAAAGYGTPTMYRYRSQPERDRLIDVVQSTYREELIRISQLIHAKPSAAVRAFARSFKLKKDGE